MMTDLPEVDRRGTLAVDPAVGCRWMLADRSDELRECDAGWRGDWCIMARWSGRMDDEAVLLCR